VPARNIPRISAVAIRPDPMKPQRLGDGPASDMKAPGPGVARWGAGESGVPRAFI